MAASSKVSQNKRRRDECLNNGLTSPDAKRNNIGTLGYDSDLMAFLVNNIGNMDTNEENDAVNEVEGEMVLNGVIKSTADEIGLKGKTDNGFKSTDHEKTGCSYQMGSNKQGEFTADGYSEETSVTSRIGGFNYYDDVRADHDFFLDNITPSEFGNIMQSYLDGDSVPDIMYSDAVHGYVESREVSHGFLWEDDICEFNEQPVIQYYFASPQQEEFGINGAEFHDVWN